MSFENGYNAKDYISGCMDKYRADSFIFQKALQTIMFFAALPQWPHNYDKMKEAVSLILSCDFGWFLRFMGQYLAYKGSETVRQIDWSYTTPQFVSEAEAFFLTVNDFLFRATESRICPLKIYEVLCSKSSPSNVSKITFRFVRTDGASLDMEMDVNDIEKLIALLGKSTSEAKLEIYPL